MVSYDVICWHGDEVTITTGTGASWQYVTKNERGQHVYFVEVEDSEATRLERALRENSEVITYQKAVQ